MRQQIRYQTLCFLGRHIRITAGIEGILAKRLHDVKHGVDSREVEDLFIREIDPSGIHRRGSHTATNRQEQQTRQEQHTEGISASL